MPRAVEIDLDLGKLVELLLNTITSRWRLEAEIIPGYMPPNPHKDTKPSCVIRVGEWFLRYSQGPYQEYFWDMYGDDFMIPELALLALSRADAPPRGKPYMEFQIPLNKKKESPYHDDF